MKIFSLDISTNTGFAYFEDGNLKEYGLICLNNKENKKKSIAEFGKYPENYQEYALTLAKKIKAKMDSLVSEDFWDDGMILIEETTKSRAVYTQKILEFIHCQFIRLFAGRGYIIKYIKTGEWRKCIELKMTNEDKKSNQEVRKGKKRGLITKKHLSVRMANELFDLGLKIKDNDIADAILVGYVGTLGTAQYADGVISAKKDTNK